MRTTLNIDDDDDDEPMSAAGELPASPVAGFKPFPAPSGVVVTDEEVNALREIEGI